MITFRRPLKCRLLLAVLGISFVTGSSALFPIPESEKQSIHTELSQPITLILENRRTLKGNAIDVSQDQIQLASAEGAGEIVFTFDRAAIDQIKLPGDAYKNLAYEWMEEGRHEDALELMAMLYRQRGPLLPFLPSSESHFFIYYVQLLLESPKPARSIAVIERLRPQIQNTEAIQALNEVSLESYQVLEMYTEAVNLAKQWLETNKPYNTSALGYYVISVDLLRSENYEAALDLALQPIVFSSPVATDKLAHCYAVAISAAHELREKAYAKTLFIEMRERDLDWPDADRTLQPYLNEITDYIAIYEEDRPTL